MKKNFTFIMKAQLLSIMILSSTLIYGQTGGANFTLDTSIAIDPAIDGAKILLVTVNFKKITPTVVINKVNSGIALTQNVPIAWGDYSAYIRFDNGDKPTNNIDARNNGYTNPVTGTVTNFESDDTVHFDINKTYYLWFSIDFTNLTYDASVQDASTSKISSLGTGLIFRNQTATSLGFVSVLHNGQSADTIILNIIDTKIVTSITVQPHTTLVKKVFSNNFRIEGSNLAINELKFNQIVNADIYDITGKVVIRSSKVSSVNIANLSNGMYIVRTEAGVAKFIK